MGCCRPLWLAAAAAVAGAGASDGTSPPRHIIKCCRFGNSLLQVRGGDSSSYFSDDFDWEEASGDLSSDPLLDSIFPIDAPPRRQNAASVPTAEDRSSPPGRDTRARRSRSDSSSRKGNVHAVWGPDAPYRKQGTKKKPPGPPPGSPPPRATVEERRSLKRHQSVHNERKMLLSDLAISLHDSHVAAIHALIKGSCVHVPPTLFGQTIVQERSGCDERFRDALEAVQPIAVGDEVIPHEPESPSFRHIEDPALLSYWGLTPNAKLYGGAQYHRVLRYYHHLFLTSPLPPITDDEVALLTNGITEVHDASDLMRAVALLVRHKMERVVEDVLADMSKRLLYVMDRQWEMVEYSMTLHRPMGGSNGLGKAGDRAIREADLYKRHGRLYTDAESELKNVLSEGYRKFAEEKVVDAHTKSLEDARSLLRYITWDMGRARDRVRNRGQGNQGFVSHIEIIGENPSQGGETQQAGKANESPRMESGGKKKGRKKAMARHSSRMVARGGGAIGFGRRRSRDGESNDIILPREDWHEDEGDLIGGVMNQGRLDDDEAMPTTTSLVVPSTSSPIFSGDDEVLNVLLDTLSSTLVPKSDTQAGHTQAAIMRLASYVSDKMRMDLSRMVRAKFNTFFLLAFHEELGPYLRREMDAYLSRQLDG